jgi:superfamily II DNA or RNA helicase
MTLKLNSNILLNNPVNEVIAKIVQDNRFNNPVYKSNELHGLSNWATKPYIDTFLCDNNLLILPRGYMRTLLNILADHKIPRDIIDERVSNPCIYPAKLNGIVLRPYQKRAVQAAMRYDQGVIISPTGSGKSFIGLEIIRQRSEKALIIVHRTDLAEQWINIIKERFDLTPGFIGNGKWRIGNEITIAMVQTLSLLDKEFVESISKTFGLILCDEVHHAPADSFFKVLGLMEAKYRYGLSATVERRDGLEEMIYRAVGPAIETIERAEVEELGATIPVKVNVVETGFSPSTVYSWPDFMSSLVVNTERNLLIIDLAVSQNIPTLILTDRVSHAEDLSAMFLRRNIKHVLAHGQIKERDGLLEKARNATLTIGTTGLLGEGLDVSSWEKLILATPISSEIKLMQAIGRIVRAAPGKEKGLIYDLKDDCGFAGASFKKRLEIYRKNKIWVEFRKNKKAA